MPGSHAPDDDAGLLPKAITYDGGPTCRMLLPHIDALARHAPPGAGTETTAFLLNQAGVFPATMARSGPNTCPGTSRRPWPPAATSPSPTRLRRTWAGPSPLCQADDMRKYVIMGIQGSGKGTQAKMLAADIDLVHISVGDIFRWNVQNHTKMGAQVRRVMAAGELVGDDLVESVVR